MGMISDFEAAAKAEYPAAEIERVLKENDIKLDTSNNDALKTSAEVAVRKASAAALRDDKVAGLATKGIEILEKAISVKSPPAGKAVGATLRATQGMILEFIAERIESGGKGKEEPAQEAEAALEQAGRQGVKIAEVPGGTVEDALKQTGTTIAETSQVSKSLAALGIAAASEPSSREPNREAVLKAAAFDHGFAGDERNGPGARAVEQAEEAQRLEAAATGGDLGPLAEAIRQAGAEQVELAEGAATGPSAAAAASQGPKVTARG